MDHDLLYFQVVDVREIRLEEIQHIVFHSPVYMTLVEAEI